MKPNDKNPVRWDFPNNRYGMLARASRSSGMSRRCRACGQLFADLGVAQAHRCERERWWRVMSGHYLPEDAKPIRRRSKTVIKVEEKKGLLQRLLSMIGLG
jgi:hypothetical protein